MMPVCLQKIAPGSLFMASRATITDIAVAAGVSVATVDRVLNARLPVREETAKRVYEAAQKLGYHATSLIRQRLASDLPEVTLGFILQRKEQYFYQQLGAALKTAVESTPLLRGRAIIEFVDEQTPQNAVAALEAMAKRAGAIALTSLDHHSVTACIQGLKARGIPVFSMLSDFAQGSRESYIGLNNRKVGRTAAWLIWKTAKKPGKVAVFVGSHRWHGHELRETGFRSFFREFAPQFEVVDTLVNLETRQVTYEATLNLLERQPDMAGFYVAGGGMEGAIAALREFEVTRLPSVIINEETPDTIAALQDHIVTGVISTPLDQMCKSLVAMMANTISKGAAETPGQVFLPFDLKVPESI
jgi:LacI family transcriptional regulator